jgi:hypothetical protein
MMMMIGEDIDTEQLQHSAHIRNFLIITIPRHTHKPNTKL